MLRVGVWSETNLLTPPLSRQPTLLALSPKIPGKLPPWEDSIETVFCFVADGAATVNEVLLGEGDFGDVEVGRNGFTVRELEL